MGMAGWKSDQMMAGLPGIMNLAAASGSDLATTSDIVTDALTAFGEEAGEAGKLADIMATASTNANTNVELMGETFKYAAPVAGALGYNMKDVAEATGLMANAGIKGSQAGTSLRSIITRLSTDAGASSTKLGALGVLTEKLGVQFYNTDGTARNLNDVLNDARAVWGNLSDEEQINYANTIAGKNAMSGWLALMNAGEADVNKLHSALENCDGSAANMANTMQNNLQGKLTLFNSAVEGLGVQIYNYFSGPLQSVVELATNVINGITDAITPQKTALDEFVTSVKNTNSEARQSLDTAYATMEGAEQKVQELEQARTYLTGVLDNCKKYNETDLKQTSDKMTEDLKGTAKDGFGAISEGAKTAKSDAENIGKAEISTDKISADVGEYNTVLGTISTKAGEVSNATKSIADNAEPAATALGYMSEAEEGVVYITDEFAKTRISAIIGQLKDDVPELADAWDANTGALRLTVEQIDEYIGNAEKIALTEAYIKAQSEAYDALFKAEMAVQMAESGVRAATEETNKVQENAEERISANIIEQGLYSEELDHTAENMDDLQTELEDANSTYDEAKDVVESIAQAAKEHGIALDGETESQKSNTKTAEEAIPVLQQLMAEEEGTEEATEDLTEANREAIKSFKDLPGSVFDTYEKLADLQTQLGMSDTDFADWCKGQVEKVEELKREYGSLVDSVATSLSDYVNTLDSTGEEGEQSLNNLINSYETHLNEVRTWGENMKILAGMIGNGFSQELYDQIAEEGFSKSKDTVQLLVNSIDQETGKFNTEGQKAADLMLQGLTEPQTIAQGVVDMSSIGQQYAEAQEKGYVGSLEDYKKAVEEGIEQAADAGTTTAEQVGGEAGEALAESTAEGVENKEGEISDATSGSITDAKEVTLETARLFKNVGEMIPTMMGIGIHSNEKAAKQKLIDLLDAMKKDAEARETDYSIIGRGYDTSLKDGIQDTVAHDAVVQAMKDLASDVGDEAYNSKDWMKRCGEWNGQNFADGISSKQSEAAQAGGNMANAGQDAAMSYQNAYYNSGYYLSAGLADGIYSGKSRAINAAVAVAQSALNSARSVLGINSPSKEFAEIGEMSMEGLAKGLQEGTSDVNDQIRKNMSLAMDAAKTGLSEKGVEISANMANHIDMDSVQTISQMGNIQASVAEIGGIINALREDVRNFQEAFTAQGNQKAKVVLQVGSRQFDAYIVDTASAGMATASKNLLKGVGL